MACHYNSHNLYDNIYDNYNNHYSINVIFRTL